MCVWVGIILMARCLFDMLLRDSETHLVQFFFEGFRIYQVSRKKTKIWICHWKRVSAGKKSKQNEHYNNKFAKPTPLLCVKNAKLFLFYKY